MKKISFLLYFTLLFGVFFSDVSYSKEKKENKKIVKQKKNNQKKQVKKDKNNKKQNRENLGDKIVKYANTFVDVPYDRIPIGLYVDSKRIIADEEVDCMYLVFRVVELALANGDNDKSIQIALNKRFHKKGKLDEKGLVVNYDERFDYSEDMIASGKWGKSIFSKKDMSKMEGSRHYKEFFYMKKEDLIDNEKRLNKIKNGDIVFFTKDPSKRSKAQEIIGHLGILQVDKDNNAIFLIHASGSKGLDKPQGKVKKVVFNDYLKDTKFNGVYISRIKK